MAVEAGRSRKKPVVADAVEEVSAPKSRPMQVSSGAYERVSKVSTQTGISRAQIVDYLLTQHNVREIVSMLKRDDVKKRPVGKPKKRFFS